jgi:hypothetical protein
MLVGASLQNENCFNISSLNADHKPSGASYMPSGTEKKTGEGHEV